MIRLVLLLGDKKCSLRKILLLTCSYLLKWNSVVSHTWLLLFPDIRLPFKLSQVVHFANAMRIIYQMHYVLL